MRIGINDHVNGTDRTAADPAEAVRAAGARAWAGTDARLERLRSRLDHPRRVLVRDFVIFELKLLLDGLKGLVISQVAVAAFLLDIVRPRGRDFKAFYRVMDVGERIDVWLSLYGASRHAAEDPEGLMGGSREGSPTMLGQIEEIVHRVVVGEQPDTGAELYPRTRPTGGDAGPRPSGQPAPAGQPPERPEAPAQGATGPQAGPAPGAERRSSFEAENHGRRQDR